MSGAAFGPGLSSGRFKTNTGQEKEIAVINQAHISGPLERSHFSKTRRGSRYGGLLAKLLRPKWLNIGQVLQFFACLWTETESRSINTQIKNEANIQPS